MADVIVSLKELVARKLAEKNAAAEAATAAAEAQKAEAAKVATEGAAKIAEAKPLILELLDMGDHDEETLAVLEAYYTELPGLRGAVEQELRQRKTDAEQKARWAKVAAFEKEIENLPTDQLTYGLASRMVEFGALEEITPERKDQVFAYNKGVREAGNSARQTFVRQSFQKEGRIAHFYLDRKPWASAALNKHHRMLEQNRKRYNINTSGNPATSTIGAALAKAQGAGEVATPKVEVPVVVVAPKPPRSVRRATKRLTEVGEGGPTKTDSRPAEKSRGGAGSDEGSRAMRGELPEA